MVGQFLLVKYDFQLRPVLVTADFRVTGARNIFLDMPLELTRKGTRLVEVIAIHLHTQAVAASSAESAFGNLVVHQFRILGKQFADILLIVKNGTCTVIFFRSPYGHTYLVVGGAAE